MATQWREITPSDVDTWKPEIGDTVEGFVVGVEKAGPNNSNLYTLKQPDGKLIKVWGNTVLDSRLNALDKEKEIKIEYLGKMTSEKTKRSYHSFKVYVSED